MARFSGTCPDCGGRWQPGSLIRSETTEGPAVWQHATCPDDTGDLTPTHAVCTTCWLDHPDGACDR